MKAGQPRDGHVGLMFLIGYSASELVLDSTRYDASFARFNGFVSLVQILSAVTLLAILILYSVRSVRANGRRGVHWLLHRRHRRSGIPGAAPQRLPAVLWRHVRDLRADGLDRLPHVSDRLRQKAPPQTGLIAIFPEMRNESFASPCCILINCCEQECEPI